MKDIMIDIETLGTRTSSVVVQIGAVYFDRETGEIGETFKANLRHEPEYFDEFTTDYETLRWWLRQSTEAQQSIVDEEHLWSAAQAVADCADFLRNGTYLWCHATFDEPILRNMFRVYGVKFPVAYKNVRDIRTLMDLARHTGHHQVRDGVYHDALDDATFQVGYCVDAMERLSTVHRLGDSLVDKND